MAEAAQGTSTVSRRRWTKRVLALLLAGVLLGVIVWQYGTRWELLLTLSPAPLFAAAGAFVLARWLWGGMTSLCLRWLGYTVSWWEAAYAMLLMVYAEQFVSRAGLLAPAVFLKARHGLDVSVLGAMLLPVAVLQLVAMGLLGLGAQAIGRPTLHNLGLTLLFVGLSSSGLLLVAAPSLIKTDRWGWLPQIAQRILDNWRRLGGSMPRLSVLILIHALLGLVRAARLYLIFLAMGQPVDPIGVVLASALADVAGLLSITPGGLGFREAAVTFAATAIGVSPDVALTGSLLDRLVMVLTTVVLVNGGAIYANWR